MYGDWIEWGDETLLYALDDSNGQTESFLFAADVWLDGSDEPYNALIFAVPYGYEREYADAESISVVTLSDAEDYLLEEGMTDGDIYKDLGEFADYEDAKEALENWIEQW